jgi:hypothetical protein
VNHPQILPAAIEATRRTSNPIAILGIVVAIALAGLILAFIFSRIFPRD